jgi:AcrR family transcriptional regulator
MAGNRGGGRTEPGRGGDVTETREALMRTGARLMSRHGLGVPVTRIQAEAEQRNKSALTYHFGSVAGLAAAILQRHREIVEGRRATALDELGDHAGDAELAELVGLLVVPAAEELRTAHGRDYLRLLPQVTHLAEIRTGARSSPAALTRTFELMRAHLTARGVPDVDERLALVAEMHATALADRARRIEDMDPPDPELTPGHEHFVDLLTRMMTAALTAR